MIFTRLKLFLIKSRYKKIRKIGADFEKIYKASVFCDTLKSLKDKFDGQRCFLIGNGPSLSAEDLEKVRDEYSFSCNKIYKAFDKTNFRPCFYIVDDYALVKEDYENIIKVPSKETFVCLEYGKKLLKKYKKTDVKVLLKKRENSNGFPMPSRNLDEYVGGGHTVLFPAYQIAVQMGFKEIILLGVDCSFKNNGGNWFYKDNKKIPSSAEDGVRRAFEMIRQDADKRGIKVYNATRGGELEIFKRVDLDEVLRREDK